VLIFILIDDLSNDNIHSLGVIKVLPSAIERPFDYEMHHCQAFIQNIFKRRIQSLSAYGKRWGQLKYVSRRNLKAKTSFKHSYMNTSALQQLLPWFFCPSPILPPTTIPCPETSPLGGYFNFKAVGDVFSISHLP